uniref:Uncharacterized protein n=1 Tax=Romanomermis culicivorax TaxID=13658 RepID=A0A915JIV0_ROMCU
MSSSLEVTELAEPICFVTKALLMIQLNCQQWIIGQGFPATDASIPDLIVQPTKEADSNNELPVKTSIINITDRSCPLLFINFN